MSDRSAESQVCMKIIKVFLSDDNDDDEYNNFYGYITSHMLLQRHLHKEIGQDLEKF